MIGKKITIILPILLFLPCSAFFKKKTPAPKQETQVSKRIIIETVGDLVRAIEKKNRQEIDTVLDFIFSQKIADQIVATANIEEPHYKIEIQKLIDERKKTLQEAARIERRPTEIPKIKAEVIKGTKMSPPVCNIIAEYAVD